MSHISGPTWRREGVLALGTLVFLIWSAYSSSPGAFVAAVALGGLLMASFREPSPRHRAVQSRRPAPSCAHPLNRAVLVTLAAHPGLVVGGLCGLPHCHGALSAEAVDTLIDDDTRTHRRQVAERACTAMHRTGDDEAVDVLAGAWACGCTACKHIRDVDITRRGGCPYCDGDTARSGGGDTIAVFHALRCPANATLVAADERARRIQSLVHARLTLAPFDGETPWPTL